MKQNFVEEAISESWGDRCPDIDADCACCQAWAEYDRLSAAQAQTRLQKLPAAFEVLDDENGTYLTRSEEAARNTGFEYNGLYRRDSAEESHAAPPAVPGEVEFERLGNINRDVVEQLQAGYSWTTRIAVGEWSPQSVQLYIKSDSPPLPASPESGGEE